MFEDENGELMVDYDQSIIHYVKKKKLGTYHKIWADVVLCNPSFFSIAYFINILHVNCLLYKSKLSKQ